MHQICKGSDQPKHGEANSSGDLHLASNDVDWPFAARTWHRGKWLVFSRHRRGSLLATIKLTCLGRKVLRRIHDRQDVLVVQPKRPVKWSATPKPHYGCDGSKVFDVLDNTQCDLVSRLGPFPFHAFWGPKAGLASSQWIANASAEVMRAHQPQITLSIYRTWTTTINVSHRTTRTSDGSRWLRQDRDRCGL